MDQCMADLSQVPDAQIGDTAIIYGNGSDNAPDIQEISQLAPDQQNEIVSRLSSRPARIYMNTDRDLLRFMSKCEARPCQQSCRDGLQMSA